MKSNLPKPTSGLNHLILPSLYLLSTCMKFLTQLEQQKISYCSRSASLRKNDLYTWVFELIEAHQSGLNCPIQYWIVEASCQQVSIKCFEQNSGKLIVHLCLDALKRMKGMERVDLLINGHTCSYLNLPSGNHLQL